VCSLSFSSRLCRERERAHTNGAPKQCFHPSASRARFHDAETCVFAFKRLRVVDRGVRARLGTERVDGKRVDASLALVPYLAGNPC